MNKEQILQMKSEYETQLKNVLAEILNFAESDIEVNWSLEGTIVKLNRKSEDQEMHYTLNIVEDDISITMHAFKLHRNADGIIVAYEALPNSINLKTLSILHSGINKMLNTDQQSSIEAEEAHND